MTSTFTKNWLRIASLVLLAVAAVAQSKDFALKSGDRVVFFGDSITEQRLYTSYVQQFVISRYPDLNVTFINSGWTGDTVNGNPCVPCAGVGALARIERDMIAYKPTVVTLLFGMNDGLYKDFDPDLLKTYTDGLSQIIAIIKRETHARIYVMTPTVYDAEMKTTWSHTDNYNAVLDRYSEAAKEIARREGLPVIDLHTATTLALTNARKIDKSYTFFSLGDGVHPKAEGHAVMAAEIINAWGGHPARPTITDQIWSNSSREHTFEITAPLPWPAFKLSNTIENADPLVSQIGEVSFTLGTVPAGMYAVTVDGTSVGSFTSDQIMKTGIALGVSRPAQKESADVAKAVRDKEDLEFMRWRTLAKFANLGSTAAAQADVQKMTEEQFAVAREKAKFQKYEITLIRQESK
jgi:lysophospholipase L1-like esterase